MIAITVFFSWPCFEWQSKQHFRQMGKPVIETGITAHESQADSLKCPFSFQKKKKKNENNYDVILSRLVCMAHSLTLFPLGPTGPTGPGSPFRPWEQKRTIYCSIFLFSENDGFKHGM